VLLTPQSRVCVNILLGTVSKSGSYHRSTEVKAEIWNRDCPANVRPMDPKDNGTAAAGILSNLGQVGDLFSEDCLSINVWTKPQTGEKKKAVMIWFVKSEHKSQTKCE
jgi:carboxylesterase type B